MSPFQEILFSGNYRLKKNTHPLKPPGFIRSGLVGQLLGGGILNEGENASQSDPKMPQIIHLVKLIQKKTLFCYGGSDTNCGQRKRFEEF